MKLKGVAEQCILHWTCDDGNEVYGKAGTQVSRVTTSFIPLTQRKIKGTYKMYAYHHLSR
jgi:hypothetical protein